MEAIVNATGEVVVGEVKGDVLCVQSGADFDPTHTVYVLDEITLNPAPVEESFPTEMDCAFADIPAREQEMEKLEAAQINEAIRAAVAYVECLDKTMAVIDDVCAGNW